MTQRLRHFARLAAFATVVVTMVFGCLLPAALSFGVMWLMLSHTCMDRNEPLSSHFPETQGLEEFSFSPQNGLRLDAWFVPGSNGAGVIVLSGAWGGHNSMYEEAVFLHDAGYSVMTFDTPSCANPPKRTSLGYTEIKNVQAALDIMSQRPEVDPDRIGIFGFSMGGATAIMTAARDERIKAVVASGNYADLADEIRRESVGKPNLWEKWFVRFWIEKSYEWGTGVNLDEVRPIAVIGQISPRPILLIHGSAELEGSRGTDQFAAAGEPKQLWVVQGADHGQYTAFDYEGYRTRIIAFFDAYLLDR